MLLLTKYTVLYKENEICCIILLSLPSRERGLKSLNVREITSPTRSLPSRERGLKCLRERENVFMIIVAPFAGAWIEIRKIMNSILVAESLPSRERGLKCGK